MTLKQTEDLETLVTQVKSNIPSDYVSDLFQIIDEDPEYGVDLQMVADTLELSEDGYLKMQDLSYTEIETDNLKIACHMDGGSYDYWTNDMEENNMFFVSINYKEGHEGIITDEDTSKLWDTLNDLSREYDSILTKYPKEV